MNARAESALAGFEHLLIRNPASVATDLESFAALLEKWQPAQNLVSRETLADVWTRHIRDSLQLLPLLGHASHIFDVGSGGGFPALPLAIALNEGGTRFTLVESNKRKCAFLRTVVRELGLNVRVETGRVETLDPDDFPSVDVITSRATAALPLFFELISPFVRPETRLLLHKGREYGEELAQADAKWHMDVVVSTSLTDAAGVVLDIKNLTHH